MPPAYTSSDQAKTGLTAAFTPSGGSLTPEQQQAINNTASLVPTVPPSPGTQTTTQPSTQTQPTTSTSTPTTTTPTDPNQDALKSEQDQKVQADAAYQQAATQVQTTISNINSGATPLTAGEQAQIDGLKQQFQTLIDQQTLTNTGASGTANIRGFQKGAAEYDPNFQVKTIGAIVTAGQQKIADYQIKEAAAIADLTQSFKNNDIKAVQSAWDIYQKAYDEKQTTLKETIADTQKAIKDAKDAQIAAQKTYYDQVTKPLNDLAQEAAKNGAPASVLQAIQNSGDVGSAIAASGNYLQNASGDLGRYLDYSRQSQASGKTAAGYDDWLKADQAAQDRREANKAYNSAYASAKGKAAGELAANPDGTKPLKPLTEVQAKDLTYAQRSSQSNEVINNLQDKILTMTPQDYLLQKSAEGNDFFNQYVSDDLRQITQAERNFVTSVLRRESGASISASEFSTAEAQYFPRPGDDKGTLDQKAQARQTAIDSFKANVPDYDSRISDTADGLLNKAEDIATQTLKTYSTSHPEKKTEIDSRINTMEKTLGRSISATEFLQAFPEYK